MNSLLQTIGSMDSDRPVFLGERAITAGQIRQTAAELSTKIGDTDSVYLYTESAALFCAGLLAASTTAAKVCLPAHLSSTYLTEIGADRSVVITDRQVENQFALSVSLSADSCPPILEPSADLSLVFYTSGSTGAPKAVPKKTQQIEIETAILRSVWGDATGAVYSTVSHQHIYGMIFRIFWPVLSQRISSDKPISYWEQLSGKLTEGTTLVASPAHLCRLPSPSVLEGATPSVIFSSGALLKTEDAAATQNLLGSFPVEILGSTETGGIAWRQQIKPDTPWTPLPSVEIQIDQHSRLLVSSAYTDSSSPSPTGDTARAVKGGFLLLGRADRVAKVDGKRISLARVEEQLKTHPSVADVAVVSLPRKAGVLGALVELTSSGDNQFAEVGSFRLARILRREFSTRLDPAEIPKQWRFRPIPVNSQGKRPVAELEAYFEPPSAQRFGTGHVTDLTLDLAEIEIQFGPDLIWFDGHFPGQPILPGLAQVHMACCWSRRLWGWVPVTNMMSQLKFRRILRPDDTVQLRLDRNRQTSRLKFSYTLAGEVASSGIIGGGG